MTVVIVGDFVQAEEAGVETSETKRHHEDDVINEKMERYEMLLKKKRDVIDKFIKDNYSDFNHSDYTPEVHELVRYTYLISDVIFHCRNM